MWGRHNRKALNFENGTDSKNEKLSFGPLSPVGLEAMLRNDWCVKPCFLLQKTAEKADLHLSF